MNVLYEELLSNLKVISMIPENGKLCIRNGHLSIEKIAPNMITWMHVTLKRWWYQDSRQSIIVLLTNVVHRSEGFCKSLMTNMSSENHWLLKQFSTEFENSLSGIKFLIKTYDDDAGIKARLSVLSDQITECIKNINLSLNNNNGN